MHDIVCVGDAHEGIAFPYRIDPETGVSERAMDLHRNFALAARHAIEEDATLFLVLGDLFDRTHVAPVFREIVRRDVIEPLGEAGVEVYIVAGNHDQPRSFQRSTSLDDFRGYPHVSVFRRPHAEIKEIAGKRVGLILLPYMHPEQVMQLARDKVDESVPREEAYATARRLWKEWIRNRAREMDADLVVLGGHFDVQGARYTSQTIVEVVPGEFQFTRDMIPDEVDLAVFGHIHLHQTLGDKLVYTGAPERIDWGERDDPKGFLTIDVASGRWSFEPLPARPMIKVEVTVREDEDPTDAILAALPPDVDDALVRLEVTAPEEVRLRVDDRRIAERLRGSFHYDVSFHASVRPRYAAQEFTLDPLRLLEDYVTSKYADDPRKDAIRSEGEAILREVLG